MFQMIKRRLNKEIFQGVLLVLCAMVVACNAKTTKTGTSDDSRKVLSSDRSMQIAFYNVENLFDTLPSATTKDDEFTPAGKQKWTSERYAKKVVDLVAVFDSMQWPDIIGLAEVENRQVLEDLVRKMPAAHSYEIVHFDSPDDRGIDVALLFNDKNLRVISEHALPVLIRIDTAEVNTRDILYVALVHQAFQDTFHVFVNHWPSRVGGKLETAPRRMKAAQVLRSAVEGLWTAMPQAHIVIMGDFNDTPVDESIQYVLSAKGATSGQVLVNLSEPAARSGLGSYNYRGNWDMLDQVLVSESLLNHSSLGTLDFEVFYRPFLLFENERLGLTPNRTYGGPNYYGGYSDHLPVLVRALQKNPK
jgi:predicted extracellular nuclease